MFQKFDDEKDTLELLGNYTKRNEPLILTPIKDKIKEEVKQENRINGSFRTKKSYTQEKMNLDNYEYASFMDRLIATFIDLILLAIPLSIIENSYKAATKTLFTTTLFEIILPLIVTVLFWIKMGGTPGKILMNMVIIDREEKEKMSIGQSILRYFGYIPSLLFLGLGFIWIAIDDKSQAWHDKMSGTIVVKKIKNKRIFE